MDDVDAQASSRLCTGEQLICLFNFALLIALFLFLGGGVNRLNTR